MSRSLLRRVWPRPVLLGLAGLGWLVGPAPPGAAQTDSTAKISPGAAMRVPGGSPERGRALIATSGCRACHVIEGLPGPYGRVGPDLARLDRRAYLAGTFPNAPGTLVRWLRDPPAMAPRTAMPSFGFSEEEARDIAAYLLRHGTNQ